MKKLFALIISILFITSLSTADTVYLLDGKVIEGKILQNDPYYVIIDVNGLPKKYRTNQIDWIDDVDEEQIDGDTTLPSFEDIEQSKSSLILTFIDVSGVRSRMENNIAQVISNTSLENQAKLEQLVNVDEIIEAIVPVYDAYYTEQDLKELIQFYTSPIGQKSQDVTPSIMEEVMQASINYFQEKLQ